MSDPVVACVMLTRDRPAMAQRAVSAFRAQTYERKRLLIWDTSKTRPFALSFNLPDNEKCVEDVDCYSIGKLRNRANSWSDYGDSDCSIIAHWDDDDWSHPNRLAEQVALLQFSGADAVAYNQMLFWDSRKYAARRERHAEVQYVGGQHGGCMVEGYINEAWLYSGIHDQILGTSLCYWRKTWQQKPFPETGPQSDRGEDMAFVAGLKVKAVSSLVGEPRMIASVHGSNHSTVINNSREWSRVPNWDSWCGERMKL